MTDKELREIIIRCYRGKTIAILGYRDASSRQRAAFLRDHGIHVLIGLRTDDEYWHDAEMDGFTVLPVWEAAEQAQIAQSY
ncbi:Rossmann-fold NAD(P)-binding domain-containing protein [Alicyclobacillus dauci]|uniref:KARI N-terminal Rossmann domain-containing protein n=1 Tax=Alicyclobacillus dauci TaxID=1475485 RepID=A0ABY6YZ88_9BACL|nr:hypothetical protein [Alicyclobacillus dauci]WAH35291.1 hypothetical protein NZD86_13335 [Alicyclobacillus dauci]